MLFRRMLFWRLQKKVSHNFAINPNLLGDGPVNGYNVNGQKYQEIEIERTKNPDRLSSLPMHSPGTTMGERAINMSPLFVMGLSMTLFFSGVYRKLKNDHMFEGIQKDRHINQDHHSD